VPYLLSLLLPSIAGILLWPGSAEAQESKEKSALTSSRALQLSGYSQFAYTYEEEGTDTAAVKRARLTLSGEIVKNIRFKMQVDAVKSPILIDLEVDLAFRPSFNLKIGQYYVPFSLENRTSDSEMDTINRSQVVDGLAPGRDIGASGRDIGVMAMGKISIFEYMAGVFNGAGINKLDSNEHKDFGARVVARPGKFLAVGGSIYDGRHSTAQGAPEINRDRFGLEALLMLGPAVVKSEYISAKDDRLSRSGWYLQGLYNIMPKKLQAVVKWDSYDLDRDVPADRSDLLTLGGNWFFAEKTKLMVNYGLYRKEGEGAANWAIFLQFQAGF
jgi:phosphate-selective porin